MSLAVPRPSYDESSTPQPPRPILRLGSDSSVVVPPGAESETRASSASAISFAPSQGNIRIEFPDAENHALENEHKVFTFGRNPHWPRDILYTPLSGTMPYVTEWAKQHILLEFGDALLRGLGQVIFINNPMAGLLICIAAFVNDLEMAAAGMVGLVASTLTAYLFKLPRGIPKRAKAPCLCMACM